MFKAVPILAVFAALAATPAMAQQQYNSDYPATTAQPSGRYDAEQQARTPEDNKPTGTVETLRDKSMSSPNVKGQRVPEDPNTGVPEAQSRDNPKGLEGTPRP